MSPEYLRKLADLADPDETWRTAGLLGRQQMPEEWVPLIAKPIQPARGEG